jgi:hypothetical protein
MGGNRLRWLATAFAVVAMGAGSLVATAIPAAAAAPTISGFTPISGAVGTPITISGSGFTGATSVLVGVVSAPFAVVSDTTINATIPTAAVRATVSVHTPSGNATSKLKYFKVTPTVMGFLPAFGAAGTAVTINGSAFTTATKVTFNGVTAPLGAVTNTTIHTTVPAGAKTGAVVVTTSWGTGTSVAPFSVGTVFSVAGYGAVNNGTGDNTAAFGSAIAAAQAAGGGIVSVPAGTYMFVSGSPASIQIDGTVPITFAGAGRSTTKLVEFTKRRDLLSIKCDGTIIENLAFDTRTYSGGHGLGDGANNTSVQGIQVTSGTETFGILYAGPAGAKPGNGLYSTGNVINDVILSDEFKSDGFSFAFQKNGSVSNVVHTGSRISIYADSFVTVSNYQYTPGSFGATAGWVISTPSNNITITNFVSSGEGGIINNAPTAARVNVTITINGERMTGPTTNRLLIGDVKGLLVENSALDGIVISPSQIAQGTVTTTHYTSVVNKPHKGAVDQVVFS